MPPLTEDELAEAAYELLASSTLSRYSRVTRRYAARVEPKIGFGSIDLEEPVRRARELWRAVVRSNRRALEEVELAVLLTALRNVADDEVDTLLHQVATSTAPSAAWLAALARQLLRERSQAASFPWPAQAPTLITRVEIHSPASSTPEASIESRDLLERTNYAHASSF